MQLNKVLIFTDDYNGIIIDNENISILPEKLQTLFMYDMYGHHFVSPDADRDMNKLYTACVLNNIEVYCHEIKELTVEVAKPYMSMSPSETGHFGYCQPGEGMLTWFENTSGVRIFLIKDTNGYITGRFRYFTTY